MLSGEIAEEIVRTLVSSIGLVLAIPATTAVAALLCRTTPTGRVDNTDDPDDAHNADNTHDANRR